MGLDHCMHGVFHVMFRYVFHVCDYVIVCWTLNRKHIHCRMYMGNVIVWWLLRGNHNLRGSENEMNMKVLNFIEINKRSGMNLTPLRKKVMNGLVHGC